MAGFADVLSYPAHKVVTIRDMRLGIMRLCCLFFIFIYVVLYIILISGKHLKSLDAEGVFSVLLQHPTKQLCNPYSLGCKHNFTDLTELSYCEQSDMDTSGLKRRCEYMDATELTHLTDNGVMVPTRVETFRQKRGCQPSTNNGWKCHGHLWEFLDSTGENAPATEDEVQSGSGPAVPDQDVFVADVERFTLLFDHSFRAGRGEINVDHKEMNGYWLQCPYVLPGAPQDATECEKKPIYCLRDDCPEGAPRLGRQSLLQKRSPRVGASSRNQVDLAFLAEQSEVSAGDEAVLSQLSEKGQPAVAISKGDVFTLGHLLRMNRINLDKKTDKKQSLRSRGLELVLHIEYTNIVPYMGLEVFPWRQYGRKPWYTYHLTQHSSSDFLLRTMESSDRLHRTVHEWRGIRLVVLQSAAIKVWDTTAFLVALTIALLLLAVARKLTDLIAVLVLKDSSLVSEDVHLEEPPNRKPMMAVLLS